MIGTRHNAPSREAVLQATVSALRRAHRLRHHLPAAAYHTVLRMPGGRAPSEQRPIRRKSGAPANGGSNCNCDLRSHGPLPCGAPQVHEGDERTARLRGHPLSPGVPRAGLARGHRYEHSGAMKLCLGPFLDDFPHSLLHRAAVQPCPCGDVRVSLVAELDAFDVMSEWKTHVMSTFVTVYGRRVTRFFEARRAGTLAGSAIPRDETARGARTAPDGRGRSRYSFGSNLSFPAVICESCQARSAGTRSRQLVRDAFVIPRARAIALFVPKWRTASSVFMRLKIKHAIR